MKPLSLLESLPDNLLDRITSETVISCPSLNLTLLSELGSNIHESAARVLFATLVLEDDARYVTAELKSSTLSILLNPVKYGPLVRSLEIIDPTRFEMPGTPVHLFETEASSNSSFSATSELLPLTGLDLNRILHALPYLETFSWRATTCPPDGICETLSTYNPRLSNFTYLPLGTLLPSSKNGLLRWDGLSLPLLSNLSLTTLRLSRLSHVGARSLSNLLSLLEEESSLESVSIDTNWLDESICQQLGHVCRKAKRLEFASDGTRLTDGCIVTLLSLCEYLEEFRLGDIQGRLSKALWEKVDDFPSHLKRFKISISEATLHHSWAIDHLSSLQFLPLSALTHLSIARISNPFQLHVHEVASLKPIPAEFVQALRAAKSLRHLTCDWWSWMAEELKVPMENCPDLQSLCVAFDGSFSKLLSSSLPMSSAIFLETFAVFIPPEHMPTLPPSPATTHRAVSRSPSASPLQHTRRLSMSVGASTDLTNEEKLGSTRVSATVSESGIHLREIRKFVRRSPALREITWYGRNGIQGKWSVSRSFTGTQSSVNQTVEYIYCPALSENVYDRFQREENASRAGWSPGTVEREEANWTGPNAELYRSLRAAEKDNEEKQAREEKAARLSSRKGGLGIEMPKQPPKTNNSPSLDGPPAQFPSPVSPVEPKPILSPNHSTRERRHTSASLGSRSNGERVQSDDMAPQQYKPRDQLETSRSKGYRGSSRGRGFDKRGAHTGSEGRPRAVSNGTIMSKKEPESASASNRGGNARGGRFIRGTRGTGSRSRRAEY